MRLKGPYLTLVGGVAVAGTLLALSTNAVRKDVDVVAASAAAVTATQPPTDAATDPATDPAQEPAATAPAQESDAVKPVAKATPPGSYVGPVKGGRVWVAVAVKGKTAIAYLCDGTKVESWLQGSAADAASVKLTGKAGAKLTAKYANGRLSGTVKTAGKEWNFAIKSVKPPSALYRSARNVRNAKVVGGWIVYNGTQVGMLNRDGVETAAPRIDLATGTVTIDGTKVQTSPVDGSPLG